MRKLYLFVNGGNSMDWLYCLSLTDDGCILGGHICSHMCYMMHDLHDRPDRMEKIKAHFKDDPYEVEVLCYEECKTHLGFQSALKLANERDHNIDQANVIIEVTE